MTYIRRSSFCATCGILLSPWDSGTFTAHEFYCYKTHPFLIPVEDAEVFQTELAAERRSNAAKRGAATRKANQRKQARHV